MKKEKELESYIGNLFSAKPDEEYYRRHGSVKFEKSRGKIYVHGDEYVTEDGTYFLIKTEDLDVYISRGMIERIYAMIGDTNDQML